MKAAALGCVGAAAAGAASLEKQFPGISFTSGRRGVTDQARAMAQNVVKNRRWIVQTYTATAESASLQAWVFNHPSADTVEEIAAGLAQIMNGWTDEQKGRVSKHFSGEAWDVQPETGPRASAIIAAIHRLPGIKKFLTKEGGLVRWHAQF